MFRAATTLCMLLLSCSPAAPQQTSSSQGMWQDPFIKLPPVSERQVLGTWKLVEPESPVTRSIEVARGTFFMVARVTGTNGERIGGEAGLPLRKVSETEYRVPGAGRSRYVIQKDGTLVGYHDEDKQPFMRAVPHPELWAK
jgi:hypothetical protein